MVSIESARRDVVEAQAEVSVLLGDAESGGTEHPEFDNQPLADELYSALELLKRAERSLNGAADYE